ncbi:hypothetical protein, partial [Halothiobacillus sp.]|uniref:hypothetical protein n=1 Tax=Halothiobacillus sp. TaxID=1891311 RepID=UPI002AD4D30D
VGVQTGETLTNIDIQTGENLSKPNIQTARSYRLKSTIGELPSLHWWAGYAPIADTLPSLQNKPHAIGISSH